MGRPLFVIKKDEPMRITEQHMPGDEFLVYASKARWIKLTLTKDRRLLDKRGTEYACEDTMLMRDEARRTGVGPLSLPEGHWSEKATGSHDFQTSSSAYMRTHTRSEAEDQLEYRLNRLANTRSRKIQARILSTISRALSWLFWDNKSTRWK